MRTTVTLDDEIVKAAAEYAGIKETSALVNHVLKKFVEREATLRLWRLGGSDPDAKAPRRRRDESDESDE